MPRFRRTSFPANKPTKKHTITISANNNGGKGKGEKPSSKLTFLPNGDFKNGNGKKSGTLTVNQKLFADEWLKDRNGTRAYKVAYPHIKDSAVAAICASNLIRVTKVENYIQVQLDRLSATARIDQEWVLKRYEMLTDYCIDDFFNDDGTMKAFSEIPREKLYAIGGFKQSKKTLTTKDQTRIVNVIKEFKLSNKKDVLDSISKVLGLEKDTGEGKGGNSFDFNAPVQINVQLVKTESENEN